MIGTVESPQLPSSAELRRAELIARAKQFAALSAEFAPADAFPASALKRATLAAEVASALAMSCDTSPTQGRGWLLRTGERNYILKGLKESETLAKALASRAKLPANPATRDLWSVLRNEGTFSDRAIAATLASDSPSRARILRIVAALDRAGEAAPAPDQLVAARQKLAQIDRRQRRKTIAARGFFGRASELARLRRWFTKPVLRAPARTAYLTGEPGIGKSSLLEEMVAIANEELHALTVRIDFDRAGLDVLDLRGATMEVARQIADTIGEIGRPLYEARLKAASIARDQERYVVAEKGKTPADLVQAIVAAVSASGRPVLFVLDTLEVLRARGESHPEQLFAWIDQLVEAGLVPLRIISAGRGEAFSPDSPRVGIRIPLARLEAAVSRKMLERLEVPEGAYRAVLKIARGNPLVLRLAANVVAQAGANVLADIPFDKKMASATMAAFLYRFLLSRVPAELRELAHPGLIARRISADFLREVLAPALDQPELDKARADELFISLASEHWLVEGDPGAPGFVRHRGDMRAVLIDLLYRDRPADAAKVDRAAAAWFAAQPGDTFAVDAAYHALQLMRTGEVPPTIDPVVALRLGDDALAELPLAARKLVAQLTGARGSQYRGETANPPEALSETEAASPAAALSDYADVVPVLLSLIERADWGEGGYVVDQVTGSGNLDPSSIGADAVRAFLWRSGRWAEARALIEARVATGADDSDLNSLPFPLAAARLEIYAEFGIDRLEGLLTGETASSTAALFGKGLEAPRTAFAFLLARSGVEPLSSFNRNGDPVAAAFEKWSKSRKRGGSPVADFAFGLGRERLQRRGMKSGGDNWNNPQLLSTLTPYALFAANLAAQGTHAGLTARAEADLAQLSRGGALIGDAPLDAGTGNPFASLAEIGLFAEWADLAGALGDNPELAEIGRAAERWRRTVGGDWAYGEAPAGWTPPGPVDRTLALRIANLLEADASPAAALAQLAKWATNGDGDALWSTAQQRFAAAMADAVRAEDPIGRAGILRDAGVPAALIPPAAILLRLETKSVSAPAIQSTFNRPTSQASEGRSPMTDDQTRRDQLESMLTASPQIAEAIEKRLTDFDLPQPLLDEFERIGALKSNGGAALESVVSDADISALEAIVRLTGRPPLLIRNGAVEMQPLVDFPSDTAAKIRGMEKLLPSVGRVEFLNADASWGGTGSVVGTKGSDLLVMTNRHVASFVARRAADGAGVFVRNAAGILCGAEIDFFEEVGALVGDRSHTIKVTKISYLADDLAADIALLAISPVTGFQMPSVLDFADTEAKQGDLVALIGYPAFDSRNNAQAQAQYFQDVYDVKRFAPGVVMHGVSGSSTLSHDCTSLGGNSGSPLFAINTGKIVGLHFAGKYGKSNSAVGVTTIKAVMSGASTLVQVPTGGLETKADATHPATTFKGRKGFASAFLKNGKVRTPWPGLGTRASDLAAPSDKPAEAGELRYTHFGVKYSKVDKLPLMTAVNIDGTKAQRIKRSDDQWFFDLRIAREVQLGSGNFNDLEIDRGHMVRREDPNWGDTVAIAKLANFDTFHYVNACAQHSRLNQGKTLWQGLENYILDSARTSGFRACVFTGPVLGPDDPVIDGARVPLEFWKLVATLDADSKGLRATAYLLSQGQLIRDLMEKRSRTEANEGIVLSAYRTFQISIADLAEATGYDFSAYLASDPLARTDESVAAAADTDPRFIPLSSFEEIAL